MVLGDPMKGSFNPQRGHKPYVENHCSNPTPSAVPPSLSPSYSLRLCHFYSFKNFKQVEKIWRKHYLHQRNDNT